MIKNDRLGRALIVAGTMAVALGGGVCSSQAAEAVAPVQRVAGVVQEVGAAAHAVAGDELPELGTPVAASGLTSGLDSFSEGSPVLAGGLMGDDSLLEATQVAGEIGSMTNKVDNST
ncbi:hypothetical protein [Streptomyces sp. NPDC058412]|uniref:hypothetical protein n=1 Tax=Streptomyces sp. NPDC058412 TaxID=3346486 RepID=UPI00365D3F33